MMEHSSFGSGMNLSPRVFLRTVLSNLNVSSYNNSLDMKKFIENFDDSDRTAATTPTLDQFFEVEGRRDWTVYDYDIKNKFVNQLKADIELQISEIESSINQ